MIPEGSIVVKLVFCIELLCLVISGSALVSATGDTSNPQGKEKVKTRIFYVIWIAIFLKYDI